MVLLVCIAISMRLQLHDTDQIAYKPFHNQLRKQGFPLFVRALVERTIALRLQGCHTGRPDWRALSGYCFTRTGRHSRYIPQLAEQPGPIQ